MKPKQARTRNRGFAIVVVLGMLILMTALVVGFSNNARVELRRADYLLKSAQALHCATAGLNAAIAAVRDCNEFYGDTEPGRLFSGTCEIAVQAGRCSVTIVDESGKLNLNYLLKQNDKPDPVHVNRFLRLIDLLNRDNAGGPRISYSIVPAVIDWIDRNDEVTALPFVKWANLGAESAYYNAQQPPYPCKNAPLDTVDELLLVKDVTSETFRRIQPYITVYGDGRVNLNAAADIVLESLSENVDKALAQVIINRRNLRPFESIAELRDLPGMTDDIYNVIKQTATVEASRHYFQVICRGYVDDVSCEVTAIVAKDLENKTVDVILYKER